MIGAGGNKRPSDKSHLRKGKLLMLTDDRLIFLLFRAQHKLQNQLRTQLAAAGVRITVAQSGILFLLEGRDLQTMTELSQALSTDNSAITGLVDRLEKSGFVERTPAPNDRRAYVIHITAEGLEELDKARGVIRRVNEEIKERFTEEEIRAFKKVLDGVYQRLGNG